MKIEIVDLQKCYRIDKNKIKKIIKTILKDEKKDGELNVIFMDNKRIREVNKTFLEHDYATDVLSFAYHEPFSETTAKRNQQQPPYPASSPRGVKKPAQSRSCADDKKKPLPEETITGEIVISAEMAARTAQEHGHPVEGEVVLYVIHGLLHLLGYDDKKKRDAKKMHLKEKELLSSFGYSIPVPD